ncbi:MAG: SBBP repeat-containing protein [Deltaproteobacteria bacterium]|nr:SBBP repeat-containing protein [Deltaproteobacteria bacterium]
MGRQKFMAVAVWLSALFLYGIGLVSPGLAAEAAHKDADKSVDRLRVEEVYGKLPLYFIRNDGQADKKARFYEQGGGHAIFFAGDGVYLHLAGGGTQAGLVKLSLIGANKGAAISAVDEQAAKVNYFIGNDPSKWHANVPTYQCVLYKDVYKGVDVKYYGNNRQLEYDIIVKPGADPKTVRFSYEGIKGLRVTPEGGLGIALSSGNIIQKRPYAYQEIGGKRVEVAARFAVESGKDGEYAYGFDVASYDGQRELIIDPALVYSTYLGGNGSDTGYGIAIDSAGNAYIAGTTGSTNFPALAPYQAALSGTTDAFVTKLNAAGSALVYSTYLGGSSTETAYAIAVDSAGSAYVAGVTASNNFPTASAYKAALSGTKDAFVTKLDAAGSALVYSTYLGGTSTETAYGIAVDSGGSAYVAGTTASTNFPALTPYQAANGGGSDAFATKFNPAGSTLAYSTYLGGTGNETAYGIAVDSAGNAYVTGSTLSTNFPTAAPYQAANAGSTDAFVTKFSATGTALIYSTYIGGTLADTPYGIAVDSQGRAYITGNTSSTDYKVVAPAIQGVASGGSNMFATRLNAAGSGLEYSTYLGGGGNDFGRCIAVDSSFNAYITGYARTGFPLVNQLYTFVGNNDVVVSKINWDGSAQLFATYINSTTNVSDRGYAVSADALGKAYVTGDTNGTTYRTTVGAFQTVAGTTPDAFVTKIDTNYAPTLDYSAEAGYVTDGVEANIGTATTAFIYKAVYTDADNNAPASIQACVDAVCNAMSLDTAAAAALHDGVYANGEQYVYATTLAAGLHNYYFAASDGAAVATGAATATLSGPDVSNLTVTTASLADGTWGVAYSQFLAGSGGTAPYSWAVPLGGLPSGLSLNASTGEISGTPTTVAAYGFTVDLTDAVPVTYSKGLTIIVNPDTTAPTGTVVIDSGAAATNSATATLTLSATDNTGTVSDMRFSNDDAAWSAWEAYSTTRAGWNHSGVEGTVTVYAQFRDISLNVSASASDTITYDVTAPVTAAAPAGGVYGVAQSVTLSANEAATTYYTTDGSAPTTASPVYAVPINIAANTALKFFSRDIAGNDEAVKTETYTIDAVAPSGTISINGGAAETASSTVTLTLSATDDTGPVSQMRFSNDNVAWSAWEAYAVTRTGWTLASGYGTKTVYVHWKDVVGNVSVPYSDTIVRTYIDLAVSAITPPASMTTGALTSVSNTVTNSGDGTSAASTLNIYLSTDGVITAADTLLTTRAIGALAPGGSSAASTSITLPVTLTPGTYYIGAIADAANTNVESNETNNARASSAVTVASGVDLRVSAISGPASAVAGSSVSASNTVANGGTGSSVPATVNFYLSKDTIITAADTYIGQRSLAPLSGGASSAAATSLVIPSNTAAGSWYLGAIADAGGANAESNETNNAAASGVISIASGKPDLRVSSMTVPSTLLTGARVTMPYTVANSGTGPSVTAYAWVYLSTDAAITTADKFLAEAAISPIAAGGTADLSIILPISVSINPGVYYVGVIMDSTNTNAESNETNNITVSGPVTVARGIDLQVTALSAPASAVTGKAASVSATVKNAGAGATNGFTLALYLSTDTVITTADTLLSIIAFNGLAGGASSAVTQAVTLPVSALPRTYYIGAIVDSGSANPETNETNNTMASGAVVVTSGVDLRVSALSGPASARRSTLVSVPNTVVNSGAGTSVSSTTKFYLSTDAVITATDSFIGSRSVPILGPAGTSSATTSFYLPFVNPGTYYIGAIADADGRNAESNEANNTAAAVISVTQ